MKKIATVLVFVLAGFIFSSFTNTQSTITKKPTQQKELIAKGKALFTAKTCTTCHKVDTKLIGPAVQTIAKTYAAKKGDLLKFFKGESKAIVDPVMAAIMDANVQAITKPMKDTDLKALVAYIKSTAK
ncbi:MAG: c-type cytochrome [Flavobacteriaceae bacterium]